MRIRDLFIGYTDGEEETLRDDFTELYIDHGDIVEKALQNYVYVITGRKGTGKTVLTYYILKTRPSHKRFISRISYGDLTVAHFSPPEKILAADEYFEIFQWILLAEISRLIFANQGLNSIDEYLTLSNFIQNSFTKTPPNSPSFIKQLLHGGVKLSFDVPTLSPSVKYELSDKLLRADNLPLYIAELKNVLAPLLQASSKGGYQYLSFIDDIDDHLSYGETGKRILHGLITAIVSVNRFVREHCNGSKVVLMLRSDIFHFVRGANINKIAADHSVTLGWGREFDRSSAIIELILTKIKLTGPKQFKSKSTSELWFDLFENQVSTVIDGAPRRINTDTFLLSRTFLRPRDLIQYLRIVQGKFSQLQRFDSYALARCETDYSFWLKEEVIGELINHYDEQYIDNLFSIVSRLGAGRFGIKKLAESYEKLSKKPPIDLEEALTVLYKFGVIGQTWVDADYKTIYRYSYTDFDVPIHSGDFFENVFVVNFGLRRALFTTDVHKARQKYK